MLGADAPCCIGDERSGVRSGRTLLSTYNVAQLSSHVVRGEFVEPADRRVDFAFVGAGNFENCLFIEGSRRSLQNRAVHREVI